MLCPLCARGEAKACGTALHALALVGFFLCAWSSRVSASVSSSLENAFLRNPGETSGLQTSSALLLCSSYHRRDLLVVAVVHAVQCTPGL